MPTTVLPPSTEPVSDLHLTLDATVYLRQLSVHLVQSLPISKTSHIAGSIPLAVLQLDKLALAAVMSSEGAIEIQGSLKSLAILDTRTNSLNVFRQILGPASTSAPQRQPNYNIYASASGASTPLIASGTSSPASEFSESYLAESEAILKDLISFHFRKSPTAGSVIAVEVYQPRIIVPLDFVFSILVRFPFFPPYATLLLTSAVLRALWILLLLNNSPLPPLLPLLHPNCHLLRLLSPHLYQHQSARQRVCDWDLMWMTLTCG